MAKRIHDIIESNEAKRRAVVEKAYLNYFNDQLLAQQVISPEEHRRMAINISTRKVSPPSR